MPPGHRPVSFGADLLAGVTLAAYAIPVSLAYATLAGLPPEVGIYGYLLGGLGYAIAYGVGRWAFPLFPRRVIVTGDDLLRLGLIVLGISVLSSLLGIWKALRVSPNEALS